MGKAWERVRGVALLLTMCTGGLLITAVTLLEWPFAALFDKTYRVLHVTTAFLVKQLLRLFVPKVEVIGSENLDQTRTPRAVMVANHQSALDAFIFGHLWNVNFRVTFKQELLFTPGIGSAMWMAGYLPVKRGDRGSGARLLERCAQLIEKHVWILFFPEGTRKIDGSTGPLGPFKAGAFKLAIDTGVPIIPITISGARTLMPARGYPRLGYGSPKLIVHPPVSSAGKTVDTLMLECAEIIASALGPDDMLPSSGGGAVPPTTAAAVPEVATTPAAASGAAVVRRRPRRDGESASPTTSAATVTAPER